MGSERGERIERRLIRAHGSVRDDIGDLITRRPLPGNALDQLDPFLFLNHHGPQTYPPGNGGLPFGPHPHRGFETVTLIASGSLEHRDSGGHQSVISAGGVQWMTAGRGLVHSELSPDEFLRAGGPLEILQLWVNLPARLKMTEPRYTGLQRDAIPSIEACDGTATVNIIAGSWNEHAGAIRSLTDVHLATIELEQNAAVVAPAPEGREVFAYVVKGSVMIGGGEVGEYHLARLGELGRQVRIEALSSSIVLFGHAQPLREPVVAHGPFVMNTHEEIEQAIRDYQAGRFR